MNPKDISILDFTYQLPGDRIAEYPLEQRDRSRLLVYRDGVITEDSFSQLAQWLPAGSLLVFNNTRVIQARLLFPKPTGAVIEIFCLEPFGAHPEYQAAMGRTGNSQWKCLIGGASKWKGGPLVKTISLQGEPATLTARLLDKLPDSWVVELSWEPAGFSFAEVIEMAGDTPLPPYIKRKAAEGDRERYQTI
jgi:S-adenosylmethionine:tRNA ribosyltransferase-isomerase